MSETQTPSTETTAWLRSNRLRARLPRFGVDHNLVLGSNLALLAFGILTSVGVSRLLGVTGRGSYVTWSTWSAALGTLAMGGLAQVVVLDDWTPGRHRLRELAAPLAVAASLAAVAIAFGAASSVISWPVAAAMIVSCASTQACAVAAAEAQRSGRMRLDFNVARLIPPVAGVVAIGVLAMSSNRSPDDWVIAVAVLQTVPLTLWLALRAERSRTMSAPLGPTFREAVKLAPGSWATTLQYRVDVLAVSLLYPARVVAFYAVGIAAQTAVFAAGQSVGMMWFGRARPTKSDRDETLAIVLRRAVGLAGALAIVVGGSAPVWVPTAYGDAFVPAVPIVAVLCAVGVCQSADYLIAHEMLLARLGSIVHRRRLPAVLFAATFYVASAVADVAPWLIAAVPGVGYVMSCALFRRSLASA